MTLPSNVQFAKTFISKQLTEALKLTKHAPQTRFSPFAMYMSSKGSTSWEAAIKSQPNIAQDDFAPAGWKIVEAAKENTVVDDGKKKAGSKLLSFFGRKSSQSDTVLRSTPPPVSPVVSSLKPGSSPRASSENTRSSTTIDPNQGSGTVLPIAVSSSSSISTPKNDSNPTTFNVPSDSTVREPTPPPSAVARFFGRFSSRASKPSDSLALSQDDLEFLSDVPTFSEPVPNHDSESDALSMMIKSPPVPTMLPAPLAPPPRLSQPTRTLSQGTKFEQDQRNDDPFSIFNSSDSTSKHTHSPMNPLTAASPSPVGVPLLNLSSNASALAQSRNSDTNNCSQGWSMTSPNDFSTPPPVPKPKPNDTFPILSQGPSQNQWLEKDSLASGSTGMIPPLPPPPGSRSHTPLRIALSPSVQAAVDFDDDDFSEFLSSSTPPAPPSFNNNALAMRLANSSSSGEAPTTTNNIFDGFDDFLGPFSSDPQPPQPPAKQISQPPVPASKSPPPNNRQTHSTQSTPRHKHTRTVSKADHARTSSLLENAARGKWLGPASPLPEALLPPDSSHVKSPSNDFFKHGSTMQAQQAEAVTVLSASFQAPTLRADEKNRSQNSSRQLASANLLQLPMSSQLSLKPLTLPMNVAVPPPEVKSSGLSAQDLSFFEGL